MKRKLSKADLKKTLASLGFKEGDEIELPSKKTSDASITDEGGEGEEDDEENGNHPPKKGGN